MIKLLDLFRKFNVLNSPEPQKVVITIYKVTGGYKEKIFDDLLLAVDISLLSSYVKLAKGYWTGTELEKDGFLHFRINVDKFLTFKEYNSISLNKNENLLFMEQEIKHTKRLLVTIKSHIGLLIPASCNVDDWEILELLKYVENKQDTLNSFIDRCLKEMDKVSGAIDQLENI